MNKVVCVLLFVSLILSLFDIRGCEGDDIRDYVYLSPAKHSIDEIVSSFNGVDAVVVDFGYGLDVVTFVPDGYGLGYIVYSNAAAENCDSHSIDYLRSGEAIAFICHAIENPLCDTIVRTHTKKRINN